MENSSYALSFCTSIHAHIPNWESAIQLMDSFHNAQAVVWYYDEIVYDSFNGTWSGRNEAEIVRLRIFDEEKELHLWRSNGELKGRLRKDSDGQDTPFVISEQMMQYKNKMLITRNYIGYDGDMQQANYIDFRFVGYKPLKGEEASHV